MNFFKDTVPYILYALLFVYVVKGWFFYKEPEKKVIPMDYSGQVFNSPQTVLETSIADKTINFDNQEECKPEEFYTISTPECDFVISTLGACIARIEYKSTLSSDGKPLNVNHSERFVRARQGAGPIGTLGLLVKGTSPVNFDHVTPVTTPEGKDGFLFTASNNGLKVEKLFWPGDKPYEINMSFKIIDNNHTTDHSSARVILCPLAILESNDAPQAVFYDWNTGSFNKMAIDPEKNVAVKMPNFFGLETKYFVSLLQCDDQKGEPNLCSNKGYFANSQNGVVAMVEVKNCAESHNTVRLYAGPRNIGALSAYKINADKTIDLGWFDMLCRFLLKIVEMLNKLLGNLGLSIIVLAIILKMLIFPLALFCKSKAAVVLKFEKENAAQLALIEKNFAKDRLKQSEEISKFYAAHGVSLAQKSVEIIPGIISIFLFFPAYSFAKYEIFYKAPFFMWIKDLSAADPYMIMPGLLGLFILSRLFTEQTIKQFGIFGFAFPILFMYMFSSAPAVMVLWIMTTFSLDIAEKAIAAKLLGQ